MINFVNVELLNYRKSIRLETKSGIALTPNGVCRMINLSKGGFALKCLKAFEFPSEWTIDVYDESGLNLQELKVRKIWSKRINKPGILSHSQVEVGWAFENLSAYQRTKLSSYLNQFVVVDKNN